MLPVKAYVLEEAYMRYAVVLFFAAIAWAQDDDAAWQTHSIVRAGRVLFDLGEYEGAVAQFREALKKDDRLGDAWYALGIAYGRLGRVAEKIQAFEAAVKVSPLSADAHYQLGLAYILNRSRTRALLEADRLGQIDPQRAATLRTLASAIIVDFHSADLPTAVSLPGDPLGASRLAR